MSLGNDVVDLQDPETRFEGLHPRFDERVFGPRERALLGAGDSGHVMRWVLWAAKESAYKALKRPDPTVVFSPRRFTVELSAGLDSAGRGATVGQVTHPEGVLDLQVHVDGTRVHAVAHSPRRAGSRLLWRVDRASSDSSASVRRLAATVLASALGLDPDAVRVEWRPPVALHRGRPLVTHLSLSHHGRFVAFASALDQPAP